MPQELAIKEDILIFDKYIKLILLLGLLVANINSLSQPHLKSDTAKQRYFSPWGHQDINREFPFFSASDQNGVFYTTDSLKKKITFINFWFEGCMPCLAEKEALDSIYRKYSINERFRFLSFTFESPERIAAFVKKDKIGYPILYISRSKINGLNFEHGFPVSMVVDDKGFIRYIVSGGFQERQKAEERVYSHYTKEIERILNEN